MMVVGVGALGRHHARILAGMNDVDLVAVADPRPDIGQSVAASCATRWAANYADCLGEVDAVSIVVPTAAHQDVALKCLERGLDVLVEKPLAARTKEGRQIVDAADERSAVLQVGHIERFNPAFIELQKSCHAPRYIRAERLSPYAFRSMDIGAVHDLMIHDIDLALALAGSSVTRIEAFGVSLVGGREDAVQARLVFRNGCIADLVANRVSPQTRRTIQVWSESGWCHADLASRTVQRIRPTGELIGGTLPYDLAMANPSDIPTLKSEMFTRFFAVDEQTFEARDQLTDELAHFVDCVRRRQRPIVSGDEGLQALEVADAVLTCVEHHQWDGHAAGRAGIELFTSAPRRAAA
jgi:predicted dehydrogenase